MNTKTHATRDEAIAAEIIAPIEASGEVNAREDFYIDELADALIGFDEHSQTFYCTAADQGEFWQTVGDAAR